MIKNRRGGFKWLWVLSDVKISVGLMLIFSILGFLSYSCNHIHSKTVIYKLPCNYSGRVVIEFNCPNGIAVNEIDEKLTFSFDSTGKISTSFSYEDFISYKNELYIWNCNEEISVNGVSDKIGRGVTGGRGTDFDTIITDTSITYSGGPTMLTYFCTHVFNNLERKSLVLDSLISKECDCESYPRMVKNDNRCD